MAISDILTQLYWGNSVLQYLFFFGYIAGAVILGKIVYYISTGILKTLTAKTQTKFDDILIDMLEEPLVFIIFVAGFYFGYKQLFLTEGIAKIFTEITRVLVIIGVSWFIMRFLDSLIINYIVPLTKKTTSDLDDHLVPIIRNLIKVIIIAITIILILDNMGYNVTSILAGLGIGGLAFALAAQDLLKNLFGGITIIMDKPFKIGEWVNVGGFEGEVVGIGLRSTRLKTAQSDFVTVPNSFFSEKGTLNAKRYDERAVAFTLGLVCSTSTSKLKKAKDIIRKVLGTTKQVDPATIYVSFLTFGQSSLDIDVRYMVKSKDAVVVRNVRDEVNIKIKDLFEKEKIDLAYPTQTLFLQK